jgi:hypothetical protein
MQPHLIWCSELETVPDASCGVCGAFSDSIFTVFRVAWVLVALLVPVLMLFVFAVLCVFVCVCCAGHLQQG